MSALRMYVLAVLVVGTSAFRKKQQRTEEFSFTQQSAEEAQNFTPTNWFQSCPAFNATSGPTDWSLSWTSGTCRCNETSELSSIVPNCNELDNNGDRLDATGTTCVTDPSEASDYCPQLGKRAFVRSHQQSDQCQCVEQELACVLVIPEKGLVDTCLLRWGARGDTAKWYATIKNSSQACSVESPAGCSIIMKSINPCPAETPECDDLDAIERTWPEDDPHRSFQGDRSGVDGIDQGSAAFENVAPRRRRAPWWNPRGWR